MQADSEDSDTVRDQKIAGEPDSDKKLCDKMTCCPQYPEGKEKWPHGKEGCCPICYEFTSTWCYNFDHGYVRSIAASAHSSIAM